MYLSELERKEIAENTLEMLDFVRLESFTEQDVKDLFESLDGNTSVKELTIEECNMDDKAAIELAKCLKEKPDIKKLHLVGNSIGDTGLRALMAVPHLEYISVALNSITNSVIEDVLKRDKSQPIVLTGNVGISETELQKIDEHFDRENPFNITTYVEPTDPVALLNEALQIIAELNLPQHEIVSLKRRFDEAFELKMGDQNSPKSTLQLFS
jgi:hypothetical protein